MMVPVAVPMVPIMALATFVVATMATISIATTVVVSEGVGITLEKWTPVCAGERN